MPTKRDDQSYADEIGKILDRLNAEIAWARDAGLEVRVDLSPAHAETVKITVKRTIYPKRSNGI